LVGRYGSLLFIYISNYFFNHSQVDVPETFSMSSKILAVEVLLGILTFVPTLEKGRILY
jgi:hypothetical protein